MNKEDDLFTIHVIINGVKLPLRIRREEEELYRNAEKLVNKYLEQYSEKYSQYSVEQILTLVSYQFAVMVSKRDSVDDVNPLAHKIDALNNEIRELLN